MALFSPHSAFGSDADKQVRNMLSSLHRAAAAGRQGLALSPMGARFKTSLMSDVHGTTHGKKHWKNKPLFRREGDKKFRNGQEAADML